MRSRSRSRAILCVAAARGRNSSAVAVADRPRWAINRSRKTLCFKGFAHYCAVQTIHYTKGWHVPLGPISSVIPHKGCSSRFINFGKRIENPNSGSLKILHVSGGNCEVMPARNRRDVAIFNRHRFTCRLELVLQFRPYMSGRYVEPKNSTVHGLNQIRQPFLQRNALLSALSAHPKCQLCNDNRTRVALVLMFFQPRDNACIAGLLCRLTQHIGI